jgi:3',5'-cyclic AMP phosphodiesterase CpdA
MTRIAHVSDLHVLDLRDVSPLRFLNKRVTGWANLRFKRKHVHKPEALARVLDAVHDAQPDHLVITGDLTNLALESEFEAVRRILADVVRLPHDRISVIPGNHDAYTRGAAKSARFTSYFRDFASSDRPELAASIPVGKFPFVRFVGEDVALIGMSSAIAQLPMLAGGAIGKPQLEALGRILEDPEVARRIPVLLVHHPLHVPPTLWKQVSQGLQDSRALLAKVSGLPVVFYLHGHLHVRLERQLANVRIFGATSASLLEDDPNRRAGYNLYDFERRRVTARAFVLPEAGEGAFEERALPYVA